MHGTASNGVPEVSRKCPATGDLKELPPADFRESCEYYENDCREDMKKSHPLYREWLIIIAICHFDRLSDRVVLSDR